MKKSLFIFFVILCINFLPLNVKAEESVILSETTKYYKTITYNIAPNMISMNENNSGLSYTTEVTKEEYDSANVAISRNSSTTVETTYEMMTTTISTSGNYYRYKNRLVWKNIPKVRSYDIIGIGFLSSVKVKGSTYFSQYYCAESGGCTTTTTHYPQTFTTGAATTFKLPTGNLYQLDQTFYFDVEKNTNYTVINQTINGDYAHATKTVTLNDAKNYTMNAYRILHDSSVSDKFDTIDSAEATWNGNW